MIGAGVCSAKPEIFLERHPNGVLCARDMCL